MFEWHPHILSERVFSDMKPVQFMRISINDGKELKEVFDPLAFLEEDKEIINDQYNLTNDPIVMAPTFDSENKLVEFEMEISNLGADYDETAIKIQLILILWKLIVWKKSLVWKIFQLTKQSST